MKHLVLIPGQRQKRKQERNTDVTNSIRSRVHRSHGYAIAEIPAVLYAIFILLLFPMLNLATIGLRYTFVILAAYESSLEAAVAQTFSQNGAQPGTSAQTKAAATAANIASAFNGIALNSVRTRIVVTDLQSGAVTRFDDKLAQPADTNKYLYMVEPEVVAEVNPLICMPLFGLRVPGLTEPLVADVCTRKVAENPQGLNQ